MRILDFDSNIKVTRFHNHRDYLLANYNILTPSKMRTYDETTSLGLEEYIRYCVQKADETCLPVLLKINFNSEKNNIMYPIEIPILPFTIDKLKDNTKIAYNYIWYESYDYLQFLKQCYTFDREKEINEMTSRIFEYFKRKLCSTYLINKTKKNTEICNYLENLSILKEFDLDKIKTEDISIKALDGGISGSEPEEVKIPKAVSNLKAYSQQVHEQNDSSSSIKAVYYNIKNVIGSIIPSKKHMPAQNVELDTEYYLTYYDLLKANYLVNQYISATPKPVPDSMKPSQPE